MEATKKLIMIVDHSEIVQNNLAQEFEKKGYSSIIATDGKEALQKLEEESSLGLMLTEINLPLIDGFTLIQKVRQHSAHQKLPILVLTIEKSQEAIQRGREAGATGWITKPFQADPLMKAVDRLLG